MQAFTDDAQKLLDRMTRLGWEVQFLAVRKVREWRFSKLVRVPGSGEFWRTGTDPDLQRAADAALADETPADEPIGLGRA